MKWQIIIIALFILGNINADPIDLKNAGNQTILTSQKIQTSTSDYTAYFGDLKNQTFKPKATLVKKNFEDANFSIEWIDDAPDLTQPSLSIAGNVAKYSKSNYEIQFYSIPDGLEFGAILNSKPPKNVLNFKIEHSNLEFYYQPPLTQEEIDEGSIRPENVIGSYAVFHTFKINNQYQTGKLFHIYRPYVIDSEKKQVWADLKIDGNLLTITIPQEFLDKAVYPIFLDPTFGYTTAGATSVAVTTYSVGMKLNSTLTYLASANDRVISLHLYNVGSSSTVQMAVYNMTNAGLASETLGSRIGFSTAFTGGVSAAWDYRNVSISLTADQRYTVAYGNFTGPAITTYYDSNGAMNSSASRSTTNTIPAVWVESNNQQRIYSMYATYINEAPSGFTPAFQVQIENPANQSTYTYGWNATFRTIVFGNATGYTVKYSLNEGATNTSYGNVANGTYFNITVGIVPATFTNITVWAINATTENITQNLYTINKASLSLSVSTAPSGSSVYGTSTTTTGSGCTSLFNQITCNLFFNKSASLIYQRTSAWAGVWGVGSWQTRYNTTGNENYSNADSSDSFTITQYIQWANLTLESVEANRTITYGTTNTAQGSASNVTGTLYRDGASIANPDSSKIYGNGTYNFTYVTEGNENYTYASKTWFLKVNKATNICWLYLNGAQANLTISEGSQSNATGNATANYGTLLRNEVIVSNPEITSALTNATYNYTFYADATQNYTACFATWFLFVNSIPAPTITPAFFINISSPINDSIQIFGYNLSINFTIFGNVSSYNWSYQLDLRQNVSMGILNNGSNQQLDLGNLSAGTHEVWITAQNSTITNSTYFIITIDKYQTWVNLTLNGSESNYTINIFQVIQTLATTSNGSLTLYLNGAPISNPYSSAYANGTYNFTAINSGNQNYTSSYKTWFLKVNDPYPPALTFLSPLNISYVVDDLNFILQMSANKTINTYWYQLNNSGINITFTNPTTIYVGNGTNYIQVWGNDTNNNLGYAQLYFQVNQTAITPSNGTTTILNIIEDGGLDYLAIMISVLFSGIVIFSAIFLMNRPKGNTN